MYDVGWLSAMSLEVSGRICDTMIAAPLVDENRFSYTLRDVSKDFVGDMYNDNDGDDAIS